MIILYNFFLFLISPFLLIYLFHKKGWKERIGFVKPHEKKCIWIHAVSVGEVGAAEPLIKVLNERLPKFPICLSTITSTGREVAKKTLKDFVNYIFYFPLDFPFFVINAISNLKPRFIILMETEIWPNLLYFSSLFHIPVILANGRLSPSSLKNYKRFSFLLKPLSSFFSSVLLQTEKDKEGFLSLGFPEKVLKVIGNTKFDRYFSSSSISTHLPSPVPKNSYPIVCAGSTHSKEEEIVIGTFKKIKNAYPNSKLILAPRHPERVKEIEKIIPDSLSYILRTKMASLYWQESILILDTVGELKDFYSLSDLAIIGGTFVPVGGHNPLEPLSFGVPVIHGPYTFNFSEIFSLIEGNGVKLAKNENELEKIIFSWIKDKESLRKEGEKGLFLIKKNCGATLRIWEEIERIIS